MSASSLKFSLVPLGLASISNACNSGGLFVSESGVGNGGCNI